MVQHKATSLRKARALGWLTGDDSQEAIRQLGARHVDPAAVDAVLRAAMIGKENWASVKTAIDRSQPVFDERPAVKKRLVRELERVLYFYRQHVQDYEIDRTYELADELHKRLTLGWNHPGGDFMWSDKFLIENRRRGPRLNPPLWRARQDLTALKVPFHLATVLLRATGLIPPKKNK